MDTNGATKAIILFSLDRMKIRLVIQKACLGLIKAYRYFISPLLPPSCRFSPTCSRYAIQAIEGHGVLRGGGLAFLRIIRCHPFCEGGYDPVPVVPGSKGSCQGDCDGGQNSNDTTCTTRTLKHSR